MSQYAAEPVPAGVDPELAEYLMRQFIAIQYGVNQSAWSVPTVQALPEQKLPGAIVMLNREDGGTSH